jgi:hypothetical protein
MSSRDVRHMHAVVRVGGVPEDPLVLIVEAVHRPPREGDTVGEDVGVRGARCVPTPRAAPRGRHGSPVYHAVGPSSAWSVMRATGVRQGGPTLRQGARARPAVLVVG